MVATHLSTVQRYSTKGGPRVWSTVFLIGCNLRCARCSDSEPMLPYNKLLHFSSLCHGCRNCAYAYPTAVYMEGDATHMHPYVQHMARELEEACLFDAPEWTDTQVECQQPVGQLEKDFIYYEESGGGVMFNGGELLLQTGASADTLCLLKQKYIATCAGIAGDVAWEYVERATQYCDLFPYDIKVFDVALYKEVTGMDNGRVSDNVGRSAVMHKLMRIRTVVVKGYNDDRRDLWKRPQFVASLDSMVQRAELLPYRALREGRYKSTELAYPIQEDVYPDAETLAYYTGEGQKLNLPMYAERARIHWRLSFDLITITLPMLLRKDNSVNASGALLTSKKYDTTILGVWP